MIPVRFIVTLHLLQRACCLALVAACCALIAESLAHSGLLR
ncbi:hypothetical protein NZK32_17090 [Cyanobium sp. FGCU-52]|nr:hypothetical protein [Cyanobium sp. FGCU52]